MSDTLLDPNVVPQAVIAPAPLADEPASDKAFVSDGVTYRVRVLPVHVISPSANSSSGAAAPTFVAVDISVTELDNASAVKVDANGNPIILAHSRMTVSSYAAPGLSAQDSLNLKIANLIWRAKNSTTAAADMMAVLAEWGHDGAAPTPPAPLTMPVIDITKRLGSEPPTSETTNG